MADWKVELDQRIAAATPYNALKARALSMRGTVSDRSELAKRDQIRNEYALSALSALDVNSLMNTMMKDVNHPKHEMRSPREQLPRILAAALAHDFKVIESSERSEGCDHGAWTSILALTSGGLEVKLVAGWYQQSWPTVHEYVKVKVELPKSLGGGWCGLEVLRA